MRTSDNGGVDYAIRRTEDGLFFVDYGLDPRDHDWTWSDDGSVATTFPTFADALNAAVSYGFAHREENGADAVGAADGAGAGAAADLPVPDDGYEIAAVEWSDDDPLVDFSDLGSASTIYVVRRTSDGKYAMGWGESQGAPCEWTDSRDLAVESGSPDLEEMMAVARKFGFADGDGMKDGYQMVGVAWGGPLDAAPAARSSKPSSR